MSLCQVLTSERFTEREARPMDSLWNTSGAVAVTKPIQKQSAAKR